MSHSIRIGTRQSKLALWQAKHVAEHLEGLGYQTELVPIASVGDQDQQTPLYELGVTGIFTKALDIALLRNTIDIAVHSMKDVPTELPKGIVMAAVAQRAAHHDVLVGNAIDLDPKHCTIATGSLRRKAQWLHRYPGHTIVNLRGNVDTRLQKLKTNNWQGAIFAAAGLQRLQLDKIPWFTLDWMIPAPAQGAILIVTQEKNDFCKRALQALHHRPTFTCVQLERAFLKELEGGCTAPIGALAVTQKTNTIFFTGGIFDLTGTNKAIIQKEFPVGADPVATGKNLAKTVLKNGGEAILKTLN